MLLLSELLRNIAVRDVQGCAATRVEAVSYDSRTVVRGGMFVCVRGYSTDGHRYVADALARGATVIVSEASNREPLPPLGEVTLVEVDDTRMALADMSANFYRHPSRELRLFGVTGTNGKTTTANLIARLFDAAGVKAASLGTLGVRVGDTTTELSRTTPEAPDLQRAMRDLVDRGVQAIAMEVSSHALSLHRVRGCMFDGAAFTNLTRDHLDFHETFDDYFAAKAELFTGCATASAEHKPFVGIINADDPSGGRLIEACAGPVLTYAVDCGANLRAEAVEVSREGASFVAKFDHTHLPIHLGITGRFNVYNSLAAAGVGVVSRLDAETIKRGLESVTRLDGRLEMVEEGQPFGVAVDYAHTPDGLRNVIATVREFTNGRVITLFGCGGDRDRTKRPQMGAIADAMSDLCIITSDNPRTEEPDSILADIVAGIEDATRCEIIADRKRAIEHALTLARANDFVLLAGKGHETYQILGDRTIHFDDREVAREVLRRTASG